MDFGAPHSGFVIAAYAVSVAVLMGVLIATLARDRLKSRELKKLDPVHRKDRP